MYSKSTFAKQLNEILKRRGISQRELADMLHTTEATVSRYINGHRTPNVEIAVELAFLLNVTMYELLGLEPPTPERVTPDMTIWKNCYAKATLEQREALWSTVSAFGLMAPEQKALIDALNREEKTEAV